MILDLRLYLDFAQHPKTKRLRRVCGDRGLGGLMRLWLYAAVSHRDGDLSGMSDNDINEAAGWNDAESVVNKAEQYEPDLAAVLADVGFLDGQAGERKLHNWLERQPTMVKNEAKMEAGRLGGIAKAAKSASSCQPLLGAASLADASKPWQDVATPSSLAKPSPILSSPVLSDPSHSDPSKPEEKKEQPAAAAEPAAALKPLRVKKQRTATEVHPNRQAVIDAWHAKFVEFTGGEVPTWDAKARGICDQLARLHPVDVLTKRMRNFAEAARPGVMGATSFTLDLFRATLDRWAKRPKFTWSVEMAKRAYPHCEPEGICSMMNGPHYNADGTLESEDD